MENKKNKSKAVGRKIKKPATDSKKKSKNVSSQLVPMLDALKIKKKRKRSQRLQNVGEDNQELQYTKNKRLSPILEVQEEIDDWDKIKDICVHEDDNGNEEVQVVNEAKEVISKPVLECGVRNLQKISHDIVVENRSQSCSTPSSSRCIIM